MEESNTKELEDNTAELRLEQVKRALNRKTLKSRKIQLEYNRQRAERQRLFERKRYGDIREEEKEERIGPDEGSLHTNNPLPKDYEYDPEEIETNCPHSKNYWVRRGYCIKLQLRERMLELPRETAGNYIINSGVWGELVMIYTKKGSTRMRNSNGHIIGHFISGLPGGNRESGESRTMIECIYSRMENYLYILDMLIWDDTLRLEGPLFPRYMFIRSQLDANPALRAYSPHLNQIPFTLLNYSMVSLSSLNICYYGELWMQYLMLKEQNPLSLFESIFTNSPTLLYSLNRILDYIRAHRLQQYVGWEGEPPINEHILRKISIAVGVDYYHNLYIKDGICFSHKDAAYSFGYTDKFYIWKDHFSSPHLQQTNPDEGESEAILCLTSNLRLETNEQEGVKSVSKEEANNLGLEERRNYRIAFRSINIGEGGKRELMDCRILGVSKNMLSDHWSVIAFENMATHNLLLQFQTIFTQLMHQETMIHQRIPLNDQNIQAS